MLSSEHMHRFRLYFKQSIEWVRSREPTDLIATVLCGIGLIVVDVVAIRSNDVIPSWLVIVASVSAFAMLARLQSNKRERSKNKSESKRRDK